MNSYADLTTLKSGSYLNISATTHDTYLRKLLEQSSRLIDKYCERFFYVYTGTRYFDGGPSKLYLNDDLLSITTLKTDEDNDGTFENTLTTDDYFLYPLNDYPKIKLSINPNGDYGSFASGVQKGIQIIGSFGYGNGWSATPYANSGAVVNTGGITDSATTHALATGKGASFSIGQTILIGSEQLYITGISTDTLTFERAKNGTTAAAHTAADVIYIYEYPLPIVQACLITSMRAWKRKDSAFQDAVGSPETGQIIVSKGLDPDVAETINLYKRVKYA